MDAAARRSAIYTTLTQAREPVSATTLAARFSVSRQIIVGDIALLRASGLEIAATPRGYVVPQGDRSQTKTIACRHREQDMGRELELMVDHGCQVLDVIVEHPVYGQLTGQLQLSSRYEVQQFLQGVARRGAKPLSDLTGGIHLHTVRYPSQEHLQRMLEALREAGFLLEEEQ